jgi:hypothetical protein
VEAEKSDMEKEDLRLMLEVTRQHHLKKISRSMFRTKEDCVTITQ